MNENIDESLVEAELDLSKYYIVKLIQNRPKNMV